tara:strand:- start:126 stop:503 length:378 start_codon:yes stop_codon:yes gene_type:complete
MKVCQGPLCHTYDTQDRLRGPKGAKVRQTRRRSQFYYLGGNACDTRCQQDWFDKFGDQAVNHFGKIKEPIKQTAENSWIKRRRYYWSDLNNDYNYEFYNSITKQRIELTKEQYNDNNYTIERINI